MSISVDGIVATGDAVPGDQFIDLVLTQAVHRSTPAEASMIFVVVNATTVDKAVFGVQLVADSAPEQPCYSNLYGTGNQYHVVQNEGIARDLTAVPPIHSLDHEIWCGVILHDLNVGDKVRVTFESGSILTWGKGEVLAVRGIVASPAPFPAGWFQGFGWGWNRFWSLYPGNTSKCFAGYPDNSEFMLPVPFDGRSHWTTGCLWALQDINMQIDTGTTFTTWTWADGAPTDYEFLNSGPDKVCNVLGHNDLGAPAGDFTPNFGGCWDVAPTYHANESHSVFAGIFCAGAGPAYANPGLCHGGVILSRKFKNLPQEATAPVSPTGVTGANSVIVATHSKTQPQGAPDPAGISGASGDHTILVTAKHKIKPQGAP
jgi:hypothetical protein